MPLSSRANELLQAFDQPGCSVCRLTAGSVHNYLGSLMYEYVNEPPTHMAVRAARGFCPTHAWHIQEQINASGLGIAVLYEGLVRNLLKDMGEVKPDSGRRQIVQAAGALKANGPCPACTHRTIVEEHLIRNLLEGLENAEFVEAFRRSSGICLEHLRQALNNNGSSSSKALLTSIQQDIWAQLQRDLAEYIRKNDYRFASEPMGDEGTSPRRAIEQMAGAKDIR
ncbi:MAG: hypothetical protein HY866_13300 [Chloroflexi bacterium]|nr:hypothetical protein [Chloroflexota bacterium]